MRTQRERDREKGREERQTEREIYTTDLSARALSIYSACGYMIVMHVNDDKGLRCFA